MNEAETMTLRLIHSAAMQEFLEKDFKSASLRNIVKKQALRQARSMAIMPARKACLNRWFASNMSILCGFFRKHSWIFPIFRRRSSQNIWATYPVHVWMKCFCMPTSI